jgi:signal transduction histidine kinase
MSLGLETLEVARIHEQALSRVFLPGDSRGNRKIVVQRAGNFFACVITPIEKSHRTARARASQQERLTQLLHQRSVDLAASNHLLKEQIGQRVRAEEALRKSEQHHRELLKQSRHMQEQLRFLSRQLLLAQEEERKKISRELHDVVAQTLTSINVQLSALKKKAAFNTNGLERSIARTQRLVVHSVNIVHQFARELRPAVLDDLGLIPALHTFMKNFTARTGIRVSLSAFAAVKHVNNDTRTVLYRVAQEALTNVARHAQADHAEVKIEKVDGAVVMAVKDDGKGFRQESLDHVKKPERLGLLGMRERLEMVGGSFSIITRPGKGTTVLAQIPLVDSKSRHRGRR